MDSLKVQGQGLTLFGDGLPVEGHSPFTQYLSWEFLVALLAFVFLLATIGVILFYGARPWEELWQAFFPRRVKGLFLRADVELLGLPGSAPRSTMVGYVTTLSAQTAKIITDQKIPLGSRVHLKLGDLPDRIGPKGSFFGVVSASHEHVRGGTFFENKVDLTAIPEWDEASFASFLDRLEANYSAA